MKSGPDNVRCRISRGGTRCLTRRPGFGEPMTILAMRYALRVTRTTALVGLFASTAFALGPGGPGGPGGPPRKPLPLDVGRHAEFTATKGTWISLDVSPDGQSIVFDLRGALYPMPIAGGTATRLTSGMAYDAQPRYSPDGKKVVFISDRSGGDNVWTLSLDLKDTTQVTQGNNALYVSPDYSPDGKYIVVSRSGGLGGAAKLQLYHVDGKKVVFISYLSGSDNVWPLSLHLKDTTQVTQGNNALYVSPDYSPDGKYIV